MRVIGLLRSMYRHIFLDCGHVLEHSVKEALDCSDSIILVTTLSLPTIRRTRRLLETLGAAHYPAGKVGVFVNRYANDQKELLKETEDMLGVRMAGLIPNDYGTAREAIDHGKPVASMPLDLEVPRVRTGASIVELRPTSRQENRRRSDSNQRVEDDAA